MSFFGLLFLIMLPAGIVLLWRGWRGAPELSAPRCAKCKYDLRMVRFDEGPPGQCPECGADLAGRKAVRFGEYRRRPGMMIGGAVLAGIPLLLMLVALLGVSLDWRQYRPDRWVIADLATQADDDWRWEELERRYRAGGLDAGEVEQAIGHLITHLHQLRASGRFYYGGARWEGFLESVERRGQVSAAQYESLCRAYYGPGPKVVLGDRRVRQGEPIHLTVNYFVDTPLLYEGQLVFALRDAHSLEGQPLTLRNARAPESDNADWLSGHKDWMGGLDLEVTHDLPPGEHELVLVADVGVVGDGALIGVEGLPGQKGRWPTPMASWTSEVVYQVEVLASGTPRIELVTDPAMKPRLAPPTLGVRLTEHDEPRLVIEWGPRPPLPGPSLAPLPVAVSFDVVLIMPAGEQRVGSLALREGNGYATKEAPLDSLPPDVTTVDVLLRPNPAHAEQMIGVERVWGEPIRFEDVPIHRGDL